MTSVIARRHGRSVFVLLQYNGPLRPCANDPCGTGVPGTNTSSINSSSIPRYCMQMEKPCSPRWQAGPFSTFRWRDHPDREPRTIVPIPVVTLEARHVHLLVVCDHVDFVDTRTFTVVLRRVLIDGHVGDDVVHLRNICQVIATCRTRTTTIVTLQFEDCTVVQRQRTVELTVTLALSIDNLPTNQNLAQLVLFPMPNVLYHYIMLLPRIPG